MIQPRASRYTAILQALFVTFIWSTSWVLIRIGLEDIPALTFAGLRYSLAFLFLLPLAIRSRTLLTLKSLTRTEWLQLVALGFIFYTITQGAMFVALDLLPAVTISLMLNFTSVLVAFMGIVLLSERPTWLQWVGTGIFLFGAVVYFYRDLGAIGTGVGSSQIVGFVAVGLCVLANAISAILGRASNRNQRLTSLTITVVSMGIGGILLLLSGIAAQGLPKLSLQNWLLIVTLALINTAFAFTLWNHTLRTLSAVESSIINNTMTIQIAILAWIFLDETLQALEIIGLILAVCGILFVQLRSLPTRSRESIEVGKMIGAFEETE